MTQRNPKQRSSAFTFPLAGVSVVFATTILSVLAMPGPDFGWLAWVALVPQAAWVFYSKDEDSIKAGLLICGLWLKWMVLLIWLRHVSWVAVPVLAFVMAGWEFIWWWLLRAFALGRYSQNALWGIAVCFGMGVLWGGMELVRSQPWGFPMLHWAVSQWKHPALLSVCSWVGGYGLSSLMVTFNLLLAYLLRRHFDITAPVKRCLGTLLIAGVVCAVWVGSRDFLDSFPSGEKQVETVRIAVVQPYQPAYRVWTSERMHASMDTVFRLSMDLARTEEFDWMLWPEGTLPWSIAEGNALDVELGRFVSQGIRVPLLIGNMGQDARGVFNGVHHYDRQGIRAGPAYAKQILVPFGEFIPGRRWWPWISTVVPIPEDFVRGSESVIFTLDAPEGLGRIKVSPLICYEDCFPQLSVKAARAGAEVLFVATYDVWYGEEWGAYVHASHSVIRAAETGLPVVRCGSAGWSGSIAGGGRILQVATEQGSIYFQGATTLNLSIIRDPDLSFYARRAEWIHLLWLLVSGLMLVSLQGRLAISEILKRQP